MFKNVIVYPICGVLSLIIGLIIINAGLNVHSGEIFLWLIGVFGFLLVIPILLFAKWIQLLIRRRKKLAEEERTQWLKASVEIADNINAQIVCPSCQRASLEITDVPL